MENFATKGNVAKIAAEPREFPHRNKALTKMRRILSMCYLDFWIHFNAFVVMI